MGNKKKDKQSFFISFLWIIIGSLLSAVAIESFLIPNGLIDGGILGVAMTLSVITDTSWFPYFSIALHIPFLYLAYKAISRTFLVYMAFALVAFSLFCLFLHEKWVFHTTDTLEIVVLGGILLGAGTGLIIRTGASLDGIEILAILINKKKKLTIGQVILFFNGFIFGGYALLVGDVHPAFKSLILYIIAIRIIDTIVVGSDEIKSVMIVATHPRKLSKILLQELGVGLTIMYGRRGWSGKEQEILYVIVERLHLANLKTIVHREDPSAFIAVQTIHEITRGQQITYQSASSS